MNLPIDEVKEVPCKECGLKVKVNAKYPITEVDCRPWYCQKNDKNL